MKLTYSVLQPIDKQVNTIPDDTETIKQKCELIFYCFIKD